MQSHKKEAALLDKRFSICFSPENAAQDSAFAEAFSYLTDLFVADGSTAEDAKKRLYLLCNMILYSACDAVLGGKPYTAEQLKPTIHAMIERITDGGDNT